MSEKRFELAYEQGDWWAVRDGDITLWKEEVVDLLNQLYQENEHLIIGNKNLMKKNEQLKKEKEGWKLSTCRYINKDSILMMDCQIVQEALFELERLIEQDTEQKKKFNDFEEKFKSLVNHYIK